MTKPINQQIKHRTQDLEKLLAEINDKNPSILAKQGSLHDLSHAGAFGDFNKHDPFANFNNGQTFGKRN